MGRIGTDLDRALEVLAAGGLVAIPTETVYGLAADASNAAAVERIFQVKQRPSNHPLIVHLANPTLVDRWAVDIGPSARMLTESCWPGPLTLLLPRAAGVIDAVTGGRSTVGLRVPAHPLTSLLLQRFADEVRPGGGLAAPSANRFGKISPTTAAHVVDDLGDDVDYVLDGGPSSIGVESTIVDCTVDPPQLLRPGAITAEQITTLLGYAPATADGPSRASGMLTSHYAPRARVVLVETAAELAAAMASGEDSPVVIGAARAGDSSNSDEVSDRADDSELAAYAATLYAQLRAADDAGASVIVAVLPPAAGLGYAIRDRLIKAAAPRP